MHTGTLKKAAHEFHSFVDSIRYYQVQTIQFLIPVAQKTIKKQQKKSCRKIRWMTPPPKKKKRPEFRIRSVVKAREQ